MTIARYSSLLLAGALMLLPVKHLQASTDLWAIYQLALDNDPTYQAAVLQHDANLLNLPLAKSAFGTSVNSTAQLGQDLSDISGSSESGDDHNINLNVNLPLYDRTQTIEINQSRYSEEVSSLATQDARQALILRVADRYFNVLAASDAKEVARLEKIAIKRQMDLANERLEVGLGTRTDLFDARARFKQAEADEIRAQNIIDNNIARLKQIIGDTPEALVPLREAAPLESPYPENVDSWIESAQNANIILQVQKLNLLIAEDEIAKQQNVRSPSLSVDGNYRWTDSDTNFAGASGSYNTASVALQLKFPIYLAGTINLRTEQAGLQYNQTERLVEEARRAASAEATSAYLDVTSGISQVEALFDAITAGESALEAKEEGFNAGLTTNLDVLDAQRDLSRSRTDYLRARYNYILSVLELERAVGDLDESDIQRVNQWLGQ